MWTTDVFGTEKPIIALLHLDELPGDPAFGGSIDKVVEHAIYDLKALQDGGADGILIANEFSLPYQPIPDIAVISAMGYIIGCLTSDLRVPYGVNVVKNPLATIDLAAATGASFARSAFSGAYMGEYGLYVSNNGEAVRHRKALGATDVRLFFKVNPEADTYLVNRDIQDVARSIMSGGFADALCVSGSGAGKEPNDANLRLVHEVAQANGIPVFCNTGARVDNIAQKLRICDGVCVGSSFKKDGKPRARVDIRRVEEFVRAANSVR